MIYFLIFLFFSSYDAFSRGSDRTINAKIYGGLGFIDPGDVNEKILNTSSGYASFGDDFINSASSVSNSYNFGAMLGYQFKYRFNLSLLFDYSSFSSLSSVASETPFNFKYDGKTKTGNYYEYSTGATAYSAGLLASYNFYNNKRIGLDLLAGVLYAFSVNYYEDILFRVGGAESPDPNDATGSGLGFLFGVNFNYLLFRNLSLGFDFSYKILNFTSLIGSDGDEYPFKYPSGASDTANATAPMSVDFSGLYCLLSLRYDFSLSRNYDDSSLDKDEFSGFTFDEKKYKKELKKNDLELDQTRSELLDLKKDARKKYKEAVDKKDLKAQDTYNKVYDIIDKLEKGSWDSLSKEQKIDKLDKIKKILN